MDHSGKKNILDDLFLRSWRPYMWLVLISFLLYAQVLTFSEYTHYDDYFLIVESYAHINTVSALGNAFLEDVSHQGQGGNLYRPLLTISLMLSAQISGVQPFGYHVIDLLLHSVTCCLLFYTLQLLNFEKLFSFYGALFFCVHPALTQAVAWIAGRNDSLLAVFILLCFISVMKFLSTYHLRWYALHLFCFACAMFTKESAILFPLLALFYAFGFRKGKVFSLYILLLVEGWAIILVNWNILRAASMVVPVGDKLIAATTVLSNLGLAVYYFGKIFWPFSLAFAPVFPDAHLAAGIISAVLLSIALLLSERRDWKLIIFGVLWFLVFLIPTFYYNTAVHTPPKFYEHRVYVPFMGILFILLSLSFTGIGQTFKRIIPTLTILLTGAFALLSYYHTADFKNSITLSEYDAATSPNDPRQYRNITRMKIPDTLTSEIQAVQGRSQIQASKDTLVTKEELWRIIDNLKKGLQSDRHNPEIFHALAVAYFARGLFLSSEKSFFAALQQTPHNAVLPYNLGILYYSAHAVTKAEHAWLEALRLDPSLGDAHLNLSFLYYESGQYRSAWDHCQKALQLGKEVPLRLIQDIRIKIS